LSKRGDLTPIGAPDAAIYEDMSRLNNELAVAERRLIKANLQLDQANRELRALYDKVPVGVFRADSAGRIEQANDLFRSLTGGPVAETWLSRAHEDDKEGVGGAWRETIERGVPFDRIYRQTGDGGTRFIEIKAISLSTGHHQAAGFVGVVEDVSERRAAEDMRRNAERLTSIRQMTAGLAHNLNNIVTVILSSAEQLRDELLPDHKLQSAAKMNMRAAEQAAFLTRRLMVYAGYSLAPFSNLEIDSFCKALPGTLVLPANYSLAVELGAPGTMIAMDGNLLRETLTELVANAAKAMPGGGIIRLATTLTDRDGGRTLPGVKISISDTGLGMDEATLLRAKEPFFTTRDVGQGFGLGLSLADGAARTAGGSLTIRSRPGHGTAVELDLPLATPDMTGGGKPD
jgi:PAS domain S-box-containing protein